jgi:hypothetical protein
VQGLSPGMSGGGGGRLAEHAALPRPSAAAAPRCAAGLEGSPASHRSAEALEDDPGARIRTRRSAASVDADAKISRVMEPK